MTREDVDAMAALARRLETTPRRVLIQAAQVAGNDEADASELLRRLRRIGTRSSILAADCCNLLLTPVAGFAKTSLASALDLTWQGAHQARE